MNASQQKEGKGNLNMQTKWPSKDNQPPENSSKSETKKGNGKMKKDTTKWCYFHKSPYHSTDEWRTKQSLVAKMKVLELDLDSNSDSETDKRNQIIDAEPSATVATTKIQPEDPEEPVESERLFHS